MRIGKERQKKAETKLKRHWGKDRALRAVVVIGLMVSKHAFQLQLSEFESGVCPKYLRKKYFLLERKQVKVERGWFIKNFELKSSCVFVWWF